MGGTWGTHKGVEDLGHWGRRMPQRREMTPKTAARALGVPSEALKQRGNTVEGLKGRLKGKLATLDKCLSGLVPRHPRW